jgi:hypothetical protein
MPESIDLFATRENARFREIEKLREIRKRERIANSRKFEKVDLRDTQTLTGDRSGNTPDLRKNSRQKMRIDKELPIHAYSVMPSGKYWFEDVAMTLAVITHARMIIASRKERLHFVDDEGKKKGQIS